MKFPQSSLFAVLALATMNGSEAFLMPKIQRSSSSVPIEGPALDVECSSSTTSHTSLYFGKRSRNDHDSVSGDVDDSKDEETPSRPSKLRRWRQLLVQKPLAFLVIAAASTMISTANPQPAQASGALMAMPKAEKRDPVKEALQIHDKKLEAKAQEELRAFTEKARQIEKKKGGAARAEFEKDYAAKKQQESDDKNKSIEQLKRSLLDQGICPFTDMEGHRQVMLLKKGIDLAEIPGSSNFMEKIQEEQNPKESRRVQLKPQRQVIAFIVQDLKNRDIDPLEHFEKHKERTSMIMQLPTEEAESLVTKYRANLDEYGQIKPPAEGEMSVKEKIARGIKKKPSSSSKEAGLVAKAAAKAEKAAAKAAAKAEKAKLKEERAAAKLAAKEAKQAAKSSQQEVKAATVAAAAVLIGQGSDTTDEDTLPDEEATGLDSFQEMGTDTAVETGFTKKAIPIVPLSAGVVAVAGGGYAYKLMRDKSESDEEERQRQLQLLMGGMAGDSSSSGAALDDVDVDLSSMDSDKTNDIPKDPMPVESSAPKKRKKRGFFGKKKNSREIDIENLVASGAKAPEFSSTLAKILTFGAPGRFPSIVAMSGNMPMETFESEEACKILSSSQESAGLSKEEGAEVFANVVNCMLIDIVDLASVSLKEKDSKVTVEAIGIVVDFMNHAASLYNAIAEGVTITPVTYGGNLGKGKLEQLYSAYAVSGMQTFGAADEDFDKRVSLLQDVFQINEKKAEGLMMRAMQKKMMDMLKSGKGMEGMDGMDGAGMEEMMKAMGMDPSAMAGMDGLGPEGEVDPEQIKQMLLTLKQLKDSGSLSESDLKDVRVQFETTFGASMSDLVKQAEEREGEMTPAERETLDLMKEILG